jgi:hypothetical protein
MIDQCSGLGAGKGLFSGLKPIVITLLIDSQKTSSD